MKFNRSGEGIHVYTEGEHTFEIVKVHVVNVPNSKGYEVYHTGPRPDIKAERRAKRQKIGDPVDDTEMLNDPKDLNTMKSVKAHVGFFLMRMTESEAKPKGKNRKSA